MSDVILELREVSKTFGARRRPGRANEGIAAARGVSLAVRAGETVALVGESGAGKSTVGRIVLGLDAPDAGEVFFDGVDITRLRGRAQRRLRRRMHLIMQNPYDSLHPGMRIRDLVAEPLAVAGIDRAQRRERAARALEEVALTPASDFLHRHPHQLSGGQRQRVALARAFIARPALIVADEPTSMLDASLRAEVLGLMRTLCERAGTTFLFITHDLAVARWISDRVAVMREGRIVEVDSAERVITDPQHAYTRMLLAASDGRLPDDEAPGLRPAD